MFCCCHCCLLCSCCIPITLVSASMIASFLCPLPLSFPYRLCDVLCTLATKWERRLLSLLTALLRKWRNRERERECPFELRQLDLDWNEQKGKKWEWKWKRLSAIETCFTVEQWKLKKWIRRSGRWFLVLLHWSVYLTLSAALLMSMTLELGNFYKTHFYEFLIFTENLLVSFIKSFL